MRSRRGFSLIELIVVMAVIAALLALLAPAIQRLRESARQAQCRHHLKQIGLALHNYHDTNACFPLAFLGGSTAATPGGGGWWGWETAILPYLDQQPLFSALNPQGEQGLMSSYYKAHGTIIPEGRTVLSVLRCPSSILLSHAANVGPGTVSPEVLGYATTDYKGCGGGGSVGVFVWNQPPTRFSDITDGTSSTIAVGEASYPSRSGQFFPLWLGLYHYNYETYFDTQHPMNCTPSFADRFWVNANGDGCALSMHAGCVQFLFADGAVRPLPQTIDRALYLRLGDRDDGKAVSMDF